MEMKRSVDAAVAAAKRAGEVLRIRRNSKLEIENKADYDFVTNVDRESEAVIQKVLREAFPTDKFYGEETISSCGVDEDEFLNALRDDERMWIVDALDGTTNYIHGIPQNVISIALAVGKEIRVGVIYDPWHDHCYTAEAGKGAFLNGERIHVSDTESMDKIMFSTSYPAADMDARRYVTQRICDIGERVMSLRIYNCAALSLAYTACGHTDGHFELGLHLWDMAAGALLVQEAGGIVTNGSGSAFSLCDRDILASNARCHASLRESLCRNL